MTRTVDEDSLMWGRGSTFLLRYLHQVEWEIFKSFLTSAGVITLSSSILHLNIHGSGRCVKGVVDRVRFISYIDFHMDTKLLLSVNERIVSISNIIEEADGKIYPETKAQLQTEYDFLLKENELFETDNQIIDRDIRLGKLRKFVDNPLPVEDNPNFVWGNELLKRDLPTEDWLVDRVLPSEGFAFIVGPEACGKSFYALTMAQAVVTGEKWLDKFEVKTKTKVLFIDKENTKRRTQKRMQGLHMDGEGLCWFEYPESFELKNDKGEFTELALSAAKMVERQNIGLIVVDSFTDVMIGNENLAGDTQKFFGSFRQLFPNRSILVLHHNAKPSAGVVKTSSEMTRGSTNLMAQVYSALSVKPVRKNNKQFVIEQTKAGDSEKLPKFTVELVSAPDYQDPTKTVISEIEWKGETIDEEEKATQAKEVIEELFQVTDSVPRKDIATYCENKGVSEATFRRVLGKMVEDGILTKNSDENDKRSFIYTYIG